MKFYLGTHQPHWLKLLDVSLFISRRRMKFKNMPRARQSWALDSGGFSELSLFGEWTIGPDQYLSEIERYSNEVGLLDWCAPQDYMCEPPILAKTGLSIQEHQHRTIESVLKLRGRTVVPIIPVLQGWKLADYVDHVTQYRLAGIDLSLEQTVGLGSVCRRQATSEVAAIVTELSSYGLALHGFGVKTQGLQNISGLLKSADSMAWSFTARHAEPLPGCEWNHMNCANCSKYALKWRSQLLTSIGIVP